MAPINRSVATKVTLGNIRKTNSSLAENSTSSFSKRKAENSPLKGNLCKKAAYSNVKNDKLKTTGQENLKPILKDDSHMKTRSKINGLHRLPLNNLQPNTVSETKFSKKTKTRKAESVSVSSNVTANYAGGVKFSQKVNTSKTESSTVVSNCSNNAVGGIKPSKKVKSCKTELVSISSLVEAKLKGPVTRSSTRLSSRKSIEKSDESTSLYVSALEEISNSALEKTVPKNERLLSEFDKELLHDPHQVSLYAMEIFEYLKSRETNFPIDDYMSRQTKINENMRAVLVDWMVEVQESFELNHETLYLAVKIVDGYLCKVKVEKDKLQLVAAAALFLACKYDERLSPLIDDFIYICDNAYDADDLLAMEQNVLRHINFELSFPISYSFLRRYARCARIQMPLLTLARYILELALMEYKTVTLSDSKQAAAALYLAFKMVKHDDWDDKLVYYTGYKIDDFKNIVILFNKILHKKPNDQLLTIRKKYSHELFFKVAETPLLNDSELDLDK